MKSPEKQLKFGMWLWTGMIFGFAFYDKPVGASVAAICASIFAAAHEIARCIRSPHSAE
jgi:hypothetical protein